MNKKVCVGLLLASLSVPVFAQDAMTTLMGMAQAAVASPSAKNVISSVVPDSLNGSALVVRGGQIAGGSMPMAVTCKFVEPNACRHKFDLVPFHKYIIMKTGETSFTIRRIQTMMSGSLEHVTIHFTLD